MSRRIWSIPALTIVGVLLGRIATACSLIGPQPSVESLIHTAAEIVLAAVSDNRLPGLVELHRIEMLKGGESTTGTPLVIEGALVDHDDFNDSPFPYQFVRPGGRHGNCYAKEYRRGGTYLLLLNRVRPAQPWPPPPFSEQLSPYWAPLAPTNEQVRGASDPWVVWVRHRVQARR